MKTKFLSLITVAFLINTGHGQDYIPMPESNAIWSKFMFYYLTIPFFIIFVKMK